MKKKVKKTRIVIQFFFSKYWNTFQDISWDIVHVHIIGRAIHPWGPLDDCRLFSHRLDRYPADPMGMGRWGALTFRSKVPTGCRMTAAHNHHTCSVGRGASLL